MAGVDDRPRQLLIRTEPDGEDRVRVTVRDAGVGIAHQGIDALFDAFHTTKFSLPWNAEHPADHAAG